MYHHRLSAKPLVYPLTQYRDIRIVVHDLAVVHGNVLTEVLCFKFGMALPVGLALLRNLSAIQLPQYRRIASASILSTPIL